ncbi:MAG: PKD domain-containing protein, partial [Pseudomonadota bacterium]
MSWRSDAQTPVKSGEAVNSSAQIVTVAETDSLSPALANRLGFPVPSSQNEEVLATDSGLSKVTNPAAVHLAKATEEPLFTERTATHLDLIGTSPNNPGRKRLAMADFNLDGTEDIVVARWTDSVQLLMNNGGTLVLTPGAFANPVDTENARHAGILDANADGWPDLILRNKLLVNLGTDLANVWLGFATGQVIVGAESDPFTIRTADFDGDGDVDAVTAPGQRMLVNDGTGTLTSTPSRMESTVLLDVIKFDARDFDGDGDIDLAGPEISEEKHFVYYNDGAGNFTDALRLSLPLDSLTYIQVGEDFNGDGIADFRIYSDNQLPRAFMSTGNFVGPFPEYIRRVDGELFGDNGKHGLVHIRDIDADGDMDFILSSLELFIDRVDSLNEKTEIIVNRDVNSGTFEVFADPEYRDEESYDARITDVDLDGNMDLFIAHKSRLAVYINDAEIIPLNITAHTSVPSETNQTTDFSIELVGVQGALSVAWDMGDSTTIDSGSSLVTTHNYSAPGRYLVTVSVNDGVNSDSHVFWHTVFDTRTPIRATTSSTIVYEQGQNTDRIWSVNPDHDSVSAINLGTNQLEVEISTGEEPNSLAIGGDGLLYVVNSGDDTITVIDMSAQSVVSTYSALPLNSRPRALAFDPSPGNNTAYITLEASGQLARIDFSNLQQSIVDVGATPRELSVSGDGSRLLVSRFITPPIPGEDTRIVSTSGGGQVWVVDTASMLTTATIELPYNDKPDSETSSRGIPNYLMAPIAAPNGKNAFVPANVSNIYRGQFRDGQNREHNKLVRSMLAKLDIALGEETVASRHDFDNSAQPTAGAFDPTGNYLYLVFEASRKLRVYDVYAEEVLDSRDVGFAPRGVTVSPDGNLVAVDNYLSRSIQLFDASEFTAGRSVNHNPLIEIPKTGFEPLSPNLLLGKRLFFDAADERLSAQSYISCATCHADGGHDGRTWDFADVGEGLRNTVDLRGRSGMGHGLVHWTANFDEIQDFENDIRDIFQGSGLLTDIDFNNNTATLGTPKEGLSVDLDALADFVASLNSPGDSPYLLPSGEKTADAFAGAQVFARSNCAMCHSGSQFSDSLIGGIFHDIGTVDADTGGRLGAALIDGGLDTPTLRGLWHGAPYLHDGSAQNLQEAVLAHTSAAVGFDVALLTSVELDDLAAYLLQIGEGDSANFAPMADAGSDIFAVDTDNSGAESITLDASNSSDTDGTVTGFSWSSDSGVIIPDGESPSAFFPVGTHTILLTISDDDSATATDSVVVTVDAPLNSPPTINNPGPQQTQIGTAVELQLTASDPDVDNELIFAGNGLPTGLALDSSGLIAGTPSVAGNFNLDLSVSDGVGGTDTITLDWSIVADPNSPPTANAGNDVTVDDNDNNGFESVTLDGSASNDPDGSIDNFSWTSDSG